ncbi:MAG: GAF domain-containing sensor histidine kinase [Acidimicrobiia bacterium]
MPEAETQRDPLFDTILSIASDFSLPAVLQRIAEAARTLAGARYAALGVIGDDRSLSDFIPVGIGPATIAEIGHLPDGHGILGLLIVDPKPLRLRDLGTHPRSYGFPDNHPPMRSFLGVPVKVRDQVFGNLYLCEKRDGDEFTREDEDLVIALASAAGVAIENARLHERVQSLAVVEDRDRIARDLHDRVIQRLFATGMALQATARFTDQPELTARVQQSVEEIDETIREIRNTIFALGSSSRRGIRLDILSVADDARRTLGFAPRVHLDGPVETLVPHHISEHLLAVLREALSNVVRHAGASRVDVVVTVGADVALRVVDDGRGFAPGNGGRGLANMEERARSLGGQFTVSNDGDKTGTVLEWSVPLDR